MQKLLFYLPRGMSILLVLFFAAFITEGFAAEFGWQDSLMHLVTALLTLGMTFIAWKWPLIGGLIFFLFSIKYFLLIFSPGNLPASLIIGCTFMVTGILFMGEGYLHSRRNP